MGKLTWEQFISIWDGQFGITPTETSALLEKHFALQWERTEAVADRRLADMTQDYDNAIQRQEQRKCFYV